MKNTPYTPPRETLATATSPLNSEALAARMVLAHPHVAFHPYTCGLRGGAVAIATALIDYFLYTDARLLLQLFFCCSAHLVVTIHDPFSCKFSLV
jgi:hypothetical protein